MSRSTSGAAKSKSFVPTLRALWLGEQLRSLRQERNLSLEEVVKHLNCHEAALARYERGETPIRGSDVAALLDLYGQQDTSQRGRLLSLAGHIWRMHLWEQQSSDLDRSIYTEAWLASRADKIMHLPTRARRRFPPRSGCEAAAYHAG